MNIIRTFSGLLFTLSLFSSCQVWARAESAGRQRDKFNDSWRFHKGDAPGAEAPTFADDAWRTVRLPHDWAIEGPFDIKYNARAGGLPFHGIGWYRKTFNVPAAARGRVVTIEFEGAMNNAEVWINGHLLGFHPYGYTGFQYDLSAHLNYGRGNVIAVKLSPEDLSSRWYPGAGLYRNVWLQTKDPVHVARWATQVTTPVVSGAKADVSMVTTVENSGATDAVVSVTTAVLDPAGRTKASTTAELRVPAGASSSLPQELGVMHPQRWDLDHPVLYTAVTTLSSGGKVIDSYRTRFGIRTIRYTAAEGFFLNDRPVRFNGVCLHHDLGALGAAVNTRATERQLQIMQSMGVNAVRTSHNPPSPELVELCDRMGILLMVEAFDVWEIPKVANGYNKFFKEWHERDLREMIRRDRNSPSVVMWSVGNEIIEQREDNGAVLARDLVGIAHSEDATRPVTIGFNNYPKPYQNGMAAAVDLVGMNYKPLFYEVEKGKHPDWIIYGSETSSCTSSRGVYHLPLQKYMTSPDKQVSSYDLIGPPWAYPPDVEFAAQEKNPTVLGEFIWTGFDYLGEPTPYGGRDNSTNGYWNDDWPSRSSYFGAVDLAGFPKDRFYLYQSRWTKKPMVHVLPHWNWTGHEDEAIPVYAYSNCDEVELRVNGKSLGRKKPGIDTTPVLVTFNNYPGPTFESKYRLRWDVPYAPGSLEVIGYKDGREAARKIVRTAGLPARIALVPDRKTIAADGYDLSFVTVRIEDKDGNLCPLADNKVTFTLKGPGEIAGVDNGNAATIDPFQANWRRAFNGLALAIIRSRPGESGKILMQAESDGLSVAKLTLVAIP
ncbi:MAG: glycoside hydrolase family 2 TIM barrel-domain containing protein [Lacunisphaera sp.]|nr:glycoside hydrolase family 2 TIM barrel-domain containing protein [Lacunisphaera sp.]